MEPDIHSAAFLTPMRLAFRLYLRTGRRVSANASAALAIEAKYNHNHDPSNGQFAFSLGGAFGRINPLHMQVQNRTNPRVRIGGNSGAFRDPMTLEHTFPGLRGAPGGVMVGLADDAFDLMGPGREATDVLTIARTRQLVAQIQAVDPSYRFDSLGLPSTLEGQNRQLEQLQQERAATMYRIRGDTKPLQVETLRYLQRTVDTAYIEGAKRANAGTLSIHLSRQEAIGNYVDRSVRDQLRQKYNEIGVSVAKGGVVRVIGREYDTSGSDRTYRIPDARVGNVAFDWTLSPKTIATAQIQGFLASDFRPSAVVIVRPSQLGPKATYIIMRKGS